jgi:hypothetical protein
MIDSAIGIKAFINLQPLSPNNKAIVIPSTKVISSNSMVKGGLKTKSNYAHARALSDHYSYNFSNVNHICKASGPSTLDGRGYKLQHKSKDKKLQKTYDKRVGYNSPKLPSKFTFCKS